MSSNTSTPVRTTHLDRSTALKFICFFWVLNFAHLASASQANAQTPELGFVELIKESNQIHAYLHTRVALSEIQTVMTQYQGKNHTDDCCKSIKVSELSEIPVPENIAAGGDESMHSYRINSEIFNHGKHHYVGIAAINAVMMKQTKVGMRARHKNGSIVDIKTCYGNEGINYVKWIAGKPVEAIYFYLNMDLEGTCKDSDLPIETH